MDLLRRTLIAGLTIIALFSATLANAQITNSNTLNVHKSIFSENGFVAFNADASSAVFTVPEGDFKYVITDIVISDFHGTEKVVVNLAKSTVGCDGSAFGPAPTLHVAPESDTILNLNTGFEVLPGESFCAYGAKVAQSTYIWVSGWVANTVVGP